MVLTDPAQQSGLREIVAAPITAAGFAPFGRLITAVQDGSRAVAVDGSLDLSGGRPRFYIMNLDYRGLEFTRITRHRAVTQVLASAAARPWLLGVAPPHGLDNPRAEPLLEDIAAFAIPGGVAVLLYRGTWHAGPYFHDPSMAFFNLELENTNEAEHQSCDLAARYGVTLRFGAA